MNLLEIRAALYFNLICLGMFFFSSCGPSMSPIVNNIDEDQANQIIVVLADKGINAHKEQAPAAGTGGNNVVLWDIYVPSDQRIQAMSYLDQAGLPRANRPNLLQIFGQAGLVPSQMQEKIRYQQGLAQQIANTIRQIDGVLDADVLISFPEENPLSICKNTLPITASVFIKHNGVLDDPNLHLVTKIKELVASSVTGLSTDNVTVVGEREDIGQPIIRRIYQVAEQPKKWEKVWGLILEKDSVMSFQIIFSVLLILLLLTLLSASWFIWKMYPVLEEQGGLKHLVTLTPLKTTKEMEALKEKKEPTKPEDKNKPQGPAQFDES